MMAKNRYVMLALFLCFVIGARAANTVSLSSVSSTPGTEVTVTVSLTNTESVSALQFSIPLGEYLSYVDGSLKAGSRLGSHQLSAVEKDGMLNVMVYSMNMDAISGSSGELFTFRLMLGNAPGDVTLTPTDLVLTSTGGDTLSGNAENGRVSIRCAKAQYNSMEIDFGRVPIRDTYTKTLQVTNIGNEPLTITSVAFIDPTFSTTTSLPLEIAAGSSQNLEVKYAPKVRGDVKSQMTVVCNSISKLNTIKLLAQPFAVNELHVGDASGIADEEVTVTLTMNNMDDICGVQANFNLPEQLEYVDGSFELSSRKQDHTASASLHEGVLRLIGFSSSGKAFTGNDGEIGHFKVKLVGRNSTTLKATEAILTGVIDGKTEDVTSADYGGRITINSPQLSANNLLDFGDVPITSDVKKTFTIWNYGSAPLTISRIVFDNPAFSVEENLPLQIDIWNSQTITIVNSDKTEGDFATTMQIYSNDPDQRMFSVDVKGRVFAPNFLTFNVEEASKDLVLLTVSLDNYDEIMGVEFDLTATEGYSVSDNDVQIADRAQGLVVSSRQTDKKTVHVIAYMMSDGISRGDGELTTIGLVPNNPLSNGSYSMTISNILLGVKDLANKYAGNASQTVSFAVPSSDAVVVTANSYNRFYGDDNPMFEYTSSGSALKGEPEITCEATATTTVGTYDITISKGSLKNKYVTCINGTLTITKALLTITAKDYTIKQGEILPTFEATYEGFKNDETSTVLTKKPTITTTATSASEPGDYDITVSDAEAQNYDISYVKGKLTIAKADALTITAKSYTISYGDDLPKFEYTSEGATISGTPTITCEAKKGSPVGTYDIIISKGTVTNFNDTYVNGTLTIKKAPLTITTKDYTIKQGETLPTFEATYKGFKNNETSAVLTKQPTISTTATSASEPGDYEITASGAEAQNYEISYVKGKLTIQAQDLIPGDANNDKKVDAKDVVVITDYMTGKNPENFNIKNADVNGDGVINIAEIIQIVNQILSKD